jgi:hypothetical protein
MSLRTIYGVEKDPKKLEKNKYITLLQSRVHARTFNKMLRIFDEQIADISPSSKSSLSFSMLAKLVGRPFYLENKSRKGDDL